MYVSVRNVCEMRVLDNKSFGQQDVNGIQHAKRHRVPTVTQESLAS